MNHTKDVPMGTWKNFIMALTVLYFTFGTMTVIISRIVAEHTQSTTKVPVFFEPIRLMLDLLF